VSASFGGILRGKRLGFEWSAEYGAFIRISGDGPFCIEVSPPPLPPSRVAGADKHRRWWESAEAAELLRFIDGLPINPARATVFYVDDDGRRI
jgi:hypothetical protein